MHVVDLSSVSDAVAADSRRETGRHRDVEDQFARRHGASGSVRQVALGAIVAGHLYNEARRSVDNDVSTGNCSHIEHRTVSASEAYEML